MQTQIIAKGTGATTTANGDLIELTAPSIVRLNLDRSQIATMVREGDDLVIRLTDGQTIRIDHFYGEQKGGDSDLVLRDQQGGQWLAHPSSSGSGRFTSIRDIDDLMGAANDTHDRGGGFILPAVLGAAGLAGGIAAVASGGRDRDDSDDGDAQAPGQPTAGFTARGDSVSGRGEPGATIRVTDPQGNVIGTGTVGADGSFTIPVTTPQTNGQPANVTQTDTAGNTSPVTTVTAPDTTAPTAPTASVNGQGTTITGTGEPGATVTVRDASGQPLGSTTVGTNGSYTLPLTTPQANGGTLTVTQADPSGNVSPATTVNAPDTTPPVAPTATITGNGATVTGTGEPGATVTVRDAGGQVLGTAPVGTDGNYTLPLTTPQANGGTLTVTQADPAGNTSPATTIGAPDTTAPAAPTASLNEPGTVVTGTGEPGATVTVRDAGGQVLGTTPVAANGSYTVPLTTPQANGGTLTVTQADPAGNTSPATTVTVADTTAPAAPTATIGADGSTITGTGEPGATVTVRDAGGQVLGTAPVGTNGSYTLPLTTPQANGGTLTVTQADAAGNTSSATNVTAPDTTAPAAPVVAVSADGTTLTGTGEAGATVTVRDAAGQPIGSATVAADGGFSVTLPAGAANGQTLSVVQSDAAGNASPAATAPTPDLVAPGAPTATVSGDGTTVTGTGEPGATVTVRDAGGQTLGTVQVGTDGGYTLPLTTPQANGGNLTVSQADAAGNTSPATTVAAPDITPPVAPTATISGDGTTVTGTGEPGATVTVRDPGGQTLGTAQVGTDGGYTLPLTTPQANGGTLTVAQADAAGNTSPATSVNAPDTTAPAAPVAAVSADGTTLTGTGEAGATVTVRDAAGQSIGTATVAADGGFSVTLPAGAANGQTLSVVQSDAAGNASPTATAPTPDLVAPGAPTATVSGDGTSITGTGEPGATIQVRDAAGTVIGTATVDAQGGYTAPLTTAQANGQALSVTQSDTAGNVSPSVALTAPDITPPAPPLATLSSDGASVYGNGEPGATVRIVDGGGTVLGTAVVAADSTYVVTLTTPQTNGQQLSADQTDPAGNISLPSSVAAADIAAPDAPVATISADGSVVTGTGEPFATVTVRDPGGAVIGTATVAANGSFTTTLSPAQANGEALTLNQTDRGGNVSPDAGLLAPDITAPAGLTATISGDGAIVSGTGEAGASVTIRDPAGTVIGTATVAANGSYSATLSPAQTNGQTLQATQADAVGNVSTPASVLAPDTTAPLAPTGSVVDNGATLTGTGEAGATLTVRAADGTVLGSGLVDANGNFAVTLNPVQANGQNLQIAQSDAAGNTSPSVAVLAPDTTAPVGLTATISGDGAIVSGTGETGASVTIRDPAGTVIGTATVATNGSYSATLNPAQTNGQTLQATQADAAGNVSAPASVLAPDTTAPLAPTGSVVDNGATLTGTGEAGATLTVRAADGTVLGSGLVDANGNFAVTLNPVQANGENLQIAQSDAAGNTSPSVAVLAPDITAPIGLTAVISGDGAIVSGTGEAGASVTIRDPAGAIIGTATVAANGSYSATLNPAQTNGQTLQATQADVAGNVSAPANVLAPDTTAPLAPTGSVIDNGATLTGTGEAGATLTVRAADGTVLGSGLVDANGNFTVALNPIQANGQNLQIAQTDAGGNASPSVAVIAPDITAPIGLTAAISGDGAIVTGLGEAGATVTIRNPGGAIIGTATVDQNGSYAAVLTTPQRNGEVLQVTQADAANNVSAPATTTAPDLTAPLAPVGALSADGAQVTGTGEAGATVSVRAADGTVLGTAVVDAGGAFTVALSAPQVNGQTLSVVQADAAGNVSPALSLTATDTTTPIGLTATVDGTGTIVSGQAEAGATVTVRDPAGQVIGTATAGTTGAYAVALTTPQVNGEQLQVTQADAAGNTSPPTPATAPDITAPAAPVFALDATGANAIGTGEAGAAVTLRDADGTVIGTGTVGTDGRFTVALSPAQANGGTVGAILTDAEGNVSPVANAPAPDITAPAAPVAALDATGTIVSGTGEVGATVTVRGPDGTILGTGTVGSQGAYAIALSAAQLNSQVLGVVQADAAGNASPSITVTALDRTPPAPPVASVSADGTTLSGTGEVGAVVTITDPVGQVLATVPVGADGSFSVTLSPPLTNGQILSLTQADASGNVSQPGNATAPDLIPNDTPLAPTATVAGDGASVSGTGQAGTAITVRDANGAIIGTGTVAADGSYTATLNPAQLNGETVRVTQTDAEGDVSPPAVAIAPDLTPPAIPVAAIDATGTVVSGTGEVGATVRVLDTNGAVLGTATVGATGAYAVVLGTPQVNNQALTVVQADATGNVSPGAALTAPDLTAPLAPTGQVAGDGTSLTGTGEAGATVTVRNADGTVIGTAQVAADGSFTAPLSPVQANGQALTLTQADAAGNTSPVTAVNAPDITAPVGLTAAIDSAGTLVTGQGEAGATVTIRDPNNAVIGTATVATDGTYAVILTPAQANGELLQATQTDAAGNGSAPVPLTAPDITAPLAPAGIVSGDGTTLTGTGEAGATVTIRAPGGAVIGTALVAADGSFTAPLTPAQANGQVLTLTQADPTGNVSPVAQANAPDITAPTGLTAAINAAGTVVTGQGEAGATVTIRDPNNAVIGTATVAAGGTYTAILTTPQLDAQLLQVTQADATGNVAAPVTVVAPDRTAPLAPAGTVSGDGTTLAGTGEAGATVTIRAPDGTIIGTALVAADGSFTAPLAPAQANGQLLTLTQADPSGNVSPVAQAPAPDITAPTGLTAAINGAGTIVTGTGEAGATVTVRDALGNPLGTAVVAAGGTYAVTLTTPQANGEALTVAQADATGNTSPAIPLTAPDITAPLAPAGTVSGDGTTLTGTGEAGATVTIRAPDGSVIGTAVVAGDGSFTAPLTPTQANGQLLTLTQADPTGNVSPVAQAPAPDITAPTGLTAAINGAGTIVTGTGEAGATVTVRDALGNPLGTAVVAAGGTYAVTLTTPQANGETLTVAQADATGNTSPSIPLTAPDITAPLAPAGTVSGDGTTLTGTGEAGATVTIRASDGSVIGTAVVAGDGSFTAPLTPAQANGQLLTLTQADPTGNVSPVAQAPAPDITAPTGLTAAINGVGTIVSGTGEAGATVTIRDALGNPIGTGTVAAGGTYAVTLTTPQANGQALSVVQADATGNTSTPVPLAAPDITPPPAPTALVNGIGTVVTGTGEAGATVRILDPQGQLVGTAVVDANGAYTAALTTAQANGQVLSVTQVDPAGNPSPQIVANAPDITPPAAPTAAINGMGTVVTGTGEVGATVEVRNASGTVIGTGTVAAGGVYAVTLTSPQVAGQALNVGLRDGAGNVSASVAITAPFDISAFDNVASATVDLVPVQTNENLGNANYTALVSLGLINLDAQVLAIPNVQFTVDPGHTLAATFTYDATLSLGVASGYSVVIQRFNGTNWVAVNGGGNNTLLQVSLLGGDLVAGANLGPGQYRAFVTFDNTVGVGLLGGLRVTGVDSDFTDVGQVIPAATNGNVITDPGPGGQVDVVSPQTRVETVTVNGITTAVTADDTVVTGQWGTLIIDRDGTYNYTPNANANVVGKTDRFTYTLLDASDNERESATLTINIGSPDVTGTPVATNDVATASATFVNVVQTLPPVLDTTFGTPAASLLSGPQTGQTVDSFTVAANSTANVTLRAELAPGLSVLPSVAFTVTNSAGTVVGTASGTAVAGVGGLVGASFSVTIPNLAAGTYNYTVSSTNPLGGAYTTSVYVGETVTRLDQFTFTGATPVSGDVLANDTLGSAFVGIKVLVGGSFVDVGDAGITLTGAHGALTIDEVGRYTYQPTTPVAYAAADPIDSFTYQLVQPDGQVSTARLDVAIDIANNGVAPAFPAATLAALSVEDQANLTADVVPMMLSSAEQPEALATVDHGEARMALAMMEGQGSVEDVLSRYLDAQAPIGESGTGSTDLHAMPAPTEPIVTPDLPQDPLGYLTVSVDPEHEKPVTMHIM